MNQQTVRLSAHEVTPVGLWSLRAGAPTVAVVVPLNVPGRTAQSRNLTRRFTRTALQTLVNAGARPTLIDSSAPERPDPALAEGADGVLVLGGGVADPSVHGAEAPVLEEHGVDRRADLYALDLLHRALGRDAPVLAVGRGAHLLHLACVGARVPGLGTAPRHRGEPGQPVRLDEEVSLEPGSRLAALFGTGRITVRSHEHRPFDLVGPELRAAAVADDGVVRAAEHRDRTWVVGVQWHPEDAHGSGPDRRKLFSAFADQARSSRRGASEAALAAA
jgi:putative glutamine amidotransferase